MTQAYTLAEPIVTRTSHPTEGEKEYVVREVTIRKPVAKDLRAIDAQTGDVAKTLAMVEQLTGLTRREVDELGIADLTAIGAIIEGFTAPGLPTGPTL